MIRKKSKFELQGKLNKVVRKHKPIFKKRHVCTAFGEWNILNNMKNVIAIHLNPHPSKKFYTKQSIWELCLQASQ